MAALIKNALIKQLSKFLKNVSANQINISTLKGEGEMKNIQLDENVLMDLIELPTWLRITGAKCNKASVKIQWTKLKTHPIVIFLDKIELDMEIADPLREHTVNSNSKLFDKDSAGAYGFIDKCIDAIQLNIDSITITIKSNKFNANLNISNIYVYSVTPNWKITNDIRNTRLKDLEKEEIVLFKEISWEICRLEAYNIEPGNQTQQGTSIKLIMNPSKIQIALKKKLSDKSLINSTVRVLLNEIYWMANDTQLKSAIGTYNFLSKLMVKSFAQRRKFAYYQQQNAQNKSKTQPSPMKNNTTQDKTSNIDISKVFLQYDIHETSLHLHISNLNIHLYADDNYSGNKQIDGGALQVLFKNVCIDHYPYHKVGSSTKHWHNYNPIFKQREDWSKNLFNEFVNKLEAFINKSNIKDITQIRLRNNINLLESCTIVSLKDLCVYKVTTNMSNKQAATTSMKIKKSSPEAVKTNPTTNFQSPNDFLKTKDYFIEQQMYNSRPFVSSNYSEFNLPNDMLFVNVFFSEFYFPEEINYPVPSPQVFVQVSPILVNIDFLTLLWANTLLYSLWREKLIVDQTEKPNQSKLLNEKEISNQNKTNFHCDTYIELIMPKITLSIYPKQYSANLNFENKNFIKRPSGLEIGFARITVSNQNLASSPKSLVNFKSTSTKCYELTKDILEKNSTFKSNKSLEFDSDEFQLNAIAPCFSDTIKNENLAYLRYDLSINDDMVNTTNEASNAKLGLFLKSLNKNALTKNASKDIWLIDIESMWLDMLGENQNLSLIENTSFKVYAVNVWDFYNNQPSPDSSVHKQFIEKENKTNYRKAYERLGKIIEIQNKESNSETDLILPNVTKQRKRSNSLTTTSKMIKTENKSKYLCQKIYSSLNIIGEINDLHVFCNHSQIIFLLRLIDTIEIFTNQLKIDTEQTLKYKTNSDLNNDKNNNNTHNKLKIKSIKLDDLSDYLIEDENENDLEGTSVNVAFIINNIDVDLSINDLRKEFNVNKIENDVSHRESLTQIKNFLNEVKEEKENSVVAKEDNDLNSSKLDDKSITKEDFDLIAKQLDKELMVSYVKYIYGLSTENPNLGLSFQTVSSSNIPKQFEKDSGLNSSTDSGFLSSEKSSLSVSFSNKFSKLTAKINEVADNDLFIDDNDNLTVILSLEQDDTSSLISVDVTNGLESQQAIFQKQSSSQSLSSASESSSLTASTNFNNKQTTTSNCLPDIQQNRSNSLNSSISNRNLSNINEQTQTIITTTNIKLKLRNLNLYAQSKGDNSTALLKLDQLELRNQKSSLFSSDDNKEEFDQVLVRFKKLIKDPESKNGLVEVRLKNFKFETDIPTLNGIVELVDDDDDFNKEKNESLPVNIFIKNCYFSLNDDPFSSFENNPKLIKIQIDQIWVSKLANNQIVINEVQFGNDLKSNLINIKSNRKMSVSKEIEFLNQFKYDLTFLEFNSKFKFSSDKFASLVYLLRKSKEDNHQLKLKLEQEKEKLISEKETILNKFSLSELENLELKKEIQRLSTINEEMSKNQNGEASKLNNAEQTTDEGFVLTEKTQTTNMIDKIELERKQFESLLQGYQEENEYLKSKIKKFEDHISLLNIERECLMKKLNQAKF